VPTDRSADRRAKAAAALTQAKADAQARGDRPLSAAEEKRMNNPERAVDGGSSGRPRRPRRDDPQGLGAAIGGLLSDHGWEKRAAMGAVFGSWDEIVGKDVAAHTYPEGFADGELVVVADSTAWATQVRLLASTLVRRLNTDIGDGTVRRVKVRGPTPPKQRGAWRVPGSKGPGDTYG
jgi:predicted nucleic acid-binding Zn ribbon protein